MGTGTWTLQAGPLANASYVDVWGSSASNIYVVGNTPAAFSRSSGDGTWTHEDVPLASVSGIWGSGPTDVYIVGDQIAHKSF